MDTEELARIADAQEKILEVLQTIELNLYKIANPSDDFIRHESYYR